VLELHGWLTRVEVPELEAASTAHGPSLRLDLAHLAGADAEGLGALRRQQARGAELVAATPYIELLLERTPNADESR
jgi:hypothetical protein